MRPLEEHVAALVHLYNAALAPDGWQIAEGKSISGKVTFVAQSARRAVVFEEPTGWQKVDRQLQEMRLRLDSSETEEQYQAVGLLCREVLISVAQEIYDRDRHPLVDDKTPSDTDAKRMLEAIFEAELKGSSNEAEPVNDFETVTIAIY